MLSFNWLDLTAGSSTSFLLIFLAEIGDKSQLVCMTLAARYKAKPVILGAVLAFIVLNTLAVVFGAAIANWIPEFYLSLVVGVLFIAFGIHTLRIKSDEDNEDEDVTVRSSRNILISTFILITVAEFGDKTQLAVVALSSTHLPIGVWIGSTTALISTSLLGVWAGKTILKKVPIYIFHRTGGIIFILLGVYAMYQAFM